MELPTSALTRDDLARLGRGHEYGDRRVRAGTWLRAAPSTYLLPGAALPDRIAAAVAHAGPDAVVTGWAACRLLRLAYADDTGAVPVLVPPGRRRISTEHVRVMPTLRPPQWRWCDDVRVAAPARAVVDSGRALPDLRSVRALVLASGVPHDDLLAELDAGAKGRSALCRRALLDLLCGAASAPEAEVLEHALAVASRLPRFLLNPDVFLGGTFLGRPDGWLVGAGLGWEVESREFHAGDEAFEHTLLRADRFLEHGLPLLHLTPRRIRELGAATGELLVATVGAAAARGAVEPRDLRVVPRGPLLPLEK